MISGTQSIQYFEQITKANKKYLSQLFIRSKSHKVKTEKVETCSDDLSVKTLINSLKKQVEPPNAQDLKSQNIIVEFSSPNIAKPFHVGHLRSTIIGNYVANINNFFKNNVTRINYLGDWGTQFGFVQLGLSLAKIPKETIEKDPINSLYQAYVHANKLTEEDPTIADEARKLFSKLENGDEQTVAEWEAFRKYTINELQNTYQRINVKFDAYEWESSYGISKISNVLSQIESLNILTLDDKNRKVIHLNEKKAVPIIKSDGSSLYITRDIAAAIDRHQKYNFDAMYYVVDNAQRDHFKNLMSILHSMKLPWADKLKHINFGKIKGMSTRKGTAVFLQDILDETKCVMRKQQLEARNTKVNLDIDHPSTEVLGISAVIVNDLKHKRNQDYEFDWNTALDIKGDTGVMMQYAHCRLVSLEENSGAIIASECDPSFLKEPEAQNLILHINKFEGAIARSYRELEPCLLVHYLFQLSHSISRAFKVLRIKGEPADVANQRLLLMHVARRVLGQGMRLLGIQPLDKM
ncbi:hypothetical protein TKK_0012774 [Trichogramma kaykai]